MIAVWGSASDVEMMVVSISPYLYIIFVYWTILSLRGLKPMNMSNHTYKRDASTRYEMTLAIGETFRHIMDNFWSQILAESSVRPLYVQKYSA